MIRILILAATLLFANVAVQAEYLTTQQLLDLDRAARGRGDNEALTLLRGYASGVFDATKNVIHCMDEKDVNLAQIVQAIRDEPALHDKTADVAIGLILMRKSPMPCGSKPTEEQQSPPPTMRIGPPGQKT